MKHITIFLLLCALTACNSTATLPTPATQPDLTSWRKTESPLFATSWPPTSNTVWIRYTFAYGSNPTKLADGNYVTAPLAKTDWKKATSTTTTLSENMTQAAIQGVVPLDEAARKVLETGTRVSEYCLTLTALPNPSSSEAKEMLAYYSAWFKYNGAFLGLVRKDHAEFIDWVTANR